ncbi:swr1 complex component [Irineochytrium annulatum]|nr:swr1 complex component [Irineochytrium annulatum]
MTIPSAPTPSSAPSRKRTISEFLASFHYLDDEELTPEAMEARVYKNADLLTRTYALQSRGFLSGHTHETLRAKTEPFPTKDCVSSRILEEMRVRSTQVADLRRAKVSQTKRVSKMILRYWELKRTEGDRMQKSEEKRIRRLAKFVAGEVLRKWKVIDQVVQAKYRAIRQQEQTLAGQRHLNRIIEQSKEILAQGLMDDEDLWSASEEEEEVGWDEEEDARDASRPSNAGEPSVAGGGGRNALEREAEMPLEELLQRYGYAPRPEGLEIEEELDGGDDEEDEDEFEVEDDQDGEQEEQEGAEGEDTERDEGQREATRLEAVELVVQEGESMREVEPMEVVEHIQEVERMEDAEPVREVETVQAVEMVLAVEATPKIAPNHVVEEQVLPEDAEGLQFKQAIIQKALKEAAAEGRPVLGEEDEHQEAENRPPGTRSKTNGDHSLKAPSSTTNGHHPSDDYMSVSPVTVTAAPPPISPAKTYVRQASEPAERGEARTTPHDPIASASALAAANGVRTPDATPQSANGDADEMSDNLVVMLDNDSDANDEDVEDASGEEDEEEDEDARDRPTGFADGDVDVVMAGESAAEDAVNVEDGESSGSEDGAPDNGAKTVVPFLLHHKLREYQHQGLDWLVGLYQNGLNGILADEMGLGKTIQTIALIAYLAVEKGVWGPHLIVVPTSVMLNWECEFKKWCPGLKILTYYGSQAQRKEKRQGWSKPNAFHVCITSYQLILSDQQMLRRKQWVYMILDEAHNIKNFRSQKWQVLLGFNSQRRLLLTGTPLQNHLGELWSLLYFLMPNGMERGMPEGFGTLKEFQEWFSKPVEQLIEAGGGGEDGEGGATVKKLHTILRPYLLRRLKREVEKQMPKKYEHVVLCRLSIRQRYLYDEYMSRARTKEDLASGNYMSIISCLMQLRKVCNHPDLFEVRPVVTSLVVRGVADETVVGRGPRIIRNWLDRDHQTFMGLDLRGWGLVITGEEFKSSIALRDVATRLNPARHLDKIKMEAVGHELSVRTAVQPLPIPPNADRQKWGQEYCEGGWGMDPASFANISEYGKRVAVLRAMATTLTWIRIERINSVRIWRMPIYGRNVFELLNVTSGSSPLKDGFRGGPIDNVLAMSADNGRYMEYPNCLRSMIMTPSERLGLMADTINRFAFVTPKVKVAIGEEWMFGANADTRQAEITEFVAPKIDGEDLLHLPRVRLSIAFPDKWLLRYDCGKLQKLDMLLRNLKAGGHRALIFTQMTKMLGMLLKLFKRRANVRNSDILELFLNIHGYLYFRLDGSTKTEQRQILMERFNNDKRILVFILSTRSGGLGLNLTGADTVIFYDSDWNPAMDAQAQDRAHRIGQTRDVHIYRLISEHTIEENMLRKANQKRRLDNVVIQEGEFTTDYLQKTDWRDWLDGMGVDVGGDKGDGEPVPEGEEEASTSASGPLVLSGPPPKDWEQALAAAEDESDVIAMKKARKEVESDLNEFSESMQATPAITPSAMGLVVSSYPAAAAAGDGVVAAAEGEGAVDDGVVPAHVDEYMLRFWIWNTGLQIDYRELITEGAQGPPEPAPQVDAPLADTTLGIDVM